MGLWRRRPTVTAEESYDTHVVLSYGVWLECGVVLSVTDILICSLLFLRFVVALRAAVLKVSVRNPNAP